MLDDIARARAGMVSRVQALRCGLSDAAISARVTSKRWQRVYPGVFATFSGPLPRLAWIWAAILITSLMALVGFARAGSTVFWKCEALDRSRESLQSGERAALSVVAALAAAPAVLALLAGPATSAMDATARQLFTPSLYVEAVLGTDGVAALVRQP